MTDNKIQYTPEKVQNCINSTGKAIEQHKKIADTYQELLRSFKRIKFAMIPDFDKMIRELEESELQKILKEREDRRKHDPLNTPDSRSSARGLARTRIMKNSEFFKVYPFEQRRWEDYKFQCKQQWENDRKHFLKEGSIKASY